MKDTEAITETTTALKPVQATGAALATNDLIFDEQKFQRMEYLADIMCSGRSTVPEHLRGPNAKADCMAIILQAAQWNMLGSCFFIAQKSYFVGGIISYEAQLVNTVIINSGILAKRPEYKTFGEWSKVAGKIKYVTSQKTGKQFAAADWKREDEEGLGVEVTITLTNGQVFSHKLLLVQATVRNSTNWVNNPEQQLCYMALQQIVRRYAPDVLGGVYSNDEINPRTGDVIVNEVPASAEDQSPTEKLCAILEDKDGKEIGEVPAEESQPTTGSESPKRVTKAMMEKALEQAGCSEDIVKQYCIAGGALQEGQELTALPKNWKDGIVSNPTDLRKKVDAWVDAADASTNRVQDETNGEPTKEAHDNARKRLHASGSDRYGLEWDVKRKELCMQMFGVESSSGLSLEQMHQLIQQVELQGGDSAAVTQ